MLPSRFLNLPAARARFGDRVDCLGAFLTRVDPAADAVVEAIEAMPAGAGWALFVEPRRLESRAPPARPRPFARSSTGSSASRCGSTGRPSIAAARC